MNKVFKVIWSEARNAYVVVSEIAKNHGSKSCSTKKLLAMLIATGVMTCASVAPAMAANLAPTETKIEIGEDASASGQGSVAIGQKAVASNLVAIAIGRDAVASGVDSIAIGSSTKAGQTYSVAVGNDIGFTAYAGTAVGQQAYASGDNATAIGTMTNVDAKYNASHDDRRKAGAQSTAIGAYAGSWGFASTAVGGFSKAEGKLATAIGYNSQANVDYGTALGDYSEVTAGWGVAIGASSVADRESGVVGAFAPEGADSLTWRANGGAVSVGGSATLTRQITNVAAGSEATDAVNVAQLRAATENAGWNLSTNGVATEATNVKPGEFVDFSGDKNIEVSNTGKDVKVELNKELTGLTSVTTKNAYVTNVDASKNESVTNVGYVNNQIAGVTLTEGKGISITDKKINVKLKDGEQNLVVNEDGLSMNTTLKGIQSITGAGTGAGSISFEGSNVKVNQNTFNSDGRIQGVVAGKDDTDAVNVGQLTDYVAANDTHIKSGNYAVGEVTDSTGNKSQGVSMDIVNKEGKVTGTVTITDVAKASDVGEVNNIDSDIKNQNGSHTTVVDAVNNLNQKLDTKVGDLQYSKVEKGDIADGDSTTTAIGKLDQKLTDVAATAAKHTKVEGSSNIIVTNTAKEGEAANYKVELNKDIDVDTVKATTVTTGQTVMNNDGLKVGKDVSVTATAVTAGQTSISNDGLKVNGKTYVSDSGLNANDQKITNVADGKVEKGSTDAVNGGQLYNETRVAKDGNFVKKSNTAGENLSALDNQVTANTESIYHMNGRISDLDNRVNKVGAGAAALAALHPLDFDPDAKWDFAAGYGNYRGANAAAVGAYYRPNEDTMFSVGGTFGNGENMVNVGVSFKLGSGSSHVSTSRVAMAKEIKELRGELEAMKSAMLDANAGKKIDTSKLQLFPDVPQNHWAYEYVAQLAGNGMIEGYPDGNFAGDRPMTRYEFAAILYRAMTKGAVLSDKILSEFSHELEYFTVDTIAKDKAGNPTIQRVRIVKENKNK